MFYKKNTSDKLDIDLFKNPSSEYRGAPFWSWNCVLDKDILLEQIDFLKEMGFGGFHMHSRSGMATEYLSDDFFNLIKACTDKAKKEQMLAYLYDEDRWPSGFAGGLVTKNRKYRGRYILFTKQKETYVDFETGYEKGLTYLLACYEIDLDERGNLKSYKLSDESESENKWYAYVKTLEDSERFNNQAYVDTLSKESIDKFIEITHENYKKHVGNEFGKTIPSIFCDEPQFTTKQPFTKLSDTSAEYPWTPLLPDIYLKKYGTDIRLTLPELFWDLPDGKPSVARWRFNDIICELFTVSFMDNCAGWCENNGIKLTGHVMEEPTLLSQTRVIGEAMRTYRSMGMPGIDMLCNNTEFTTAKQAQSAVHQYGREAMASELYGVTKWTFDFRGHKFQGDWQAAMGVTVRVPHLAWVSMKGRAKRDYPASISYQSPWYKEYPYIENHYARLNTALTRGKPIADVGVIHPIESCWLRYGPVESSKDIIDDMDYNFKSLTEWLLFGLIDFDFISESLFAENGGVEDDKLKMGEMKYKTVIVPNCETIRRTTFEALKEFSKNGGKVIFIGECPKYIDASESDEVNELYDTSVRVPVSKSAILKSLEQDRFADIKINGARTDNMIYTLRRDNESDWFFAAHAKMPENKDVPQKECLTIELNGEFTPSLYDTVNGSVEKMNYKYKNGKTVIYADIYAYDSLLINLAHKKEACTYTPDNEYSVKQSSNIKHKVEYSLEEDNVYLLDMAEFAIDDGKFYPLEEIRRIDTKCREVLNFPSALHCAAQPWVVPEDSQKHIITLKFKFQSNINVSGAHIACEEADCIELNNEKIKLSPDGYYVDRSILTYPLPDIKKGENILIVKVPFGKRDDIENAYILGNFGVTISGCEKTIVKLPEKISFGDIAVQGFPFYGGNITYKIDFELDKRAKIRIKAPHFRGSLIKVSSDGCELGKIVFAPYEVVTDCPGKGTHRLEFTLFGNRSNTFAALHNYGNQQWYDGNMWYPTDTMSYEYILENTGILSSPVLEIIE